MKPMQEAGVLRIEVESQKVILRVTPPWKPWKTLGTPWTVIVRDLKKPSAAEGASVLRVIEERKGEFSPLTLSWGVRRFLRKHRLN